MKPEQKILHLISLLILCISVTPPATAQYSVKNLSDKHKQYYDSLKAHNYDRVFPILGDKVYKKGFDIPWPIGVMINTFYGEQGIEIGNIAVGVAQGDSTRGPVDLTDVIVFDRVHAKALNLNVRVDVWVLPFLNVYGLFAYLPYASTGVTLSKPVQISTEPEQTGTAIGFGIMGAGGVGPVWLQADINFTWANMELLDNTVFTRVMGFRVGHVFPLKSDPQKNISIWVGAMGVFINNNTVGQVALSDLFEGLDQTKLDQIKDSYADWYDDLTPPKQKVVDKIVERLQDRLDGINIDDTKILYQLDKSIKQPWAGLIGMQYQISKKWQLRTEANLVGDRKSILLSVNYRFLGFKKKK